MAVESQCPSCKAPIPVPRPAACPHCGAGCQAARGALSAFVRENWLWIAAPVALAAILVLALLLFSGNDDTSPFIYTI